VLRNRDQKLAGSAVTEPSPAGKPIQLATQVAGVQGPAGSQYSTSTGASCAVARSAYWVSLPAARAVVSVPLSYSRKNPVTWPPQAQAP
jgi:hypothetical protein